jgi:hypothetical protein
MKNLLLVVGTVSLFAAPAVAENAKKPQGKRPIAVAQVEKTAPRAALEIEPLVAPTLPAAATDEALALPVLPVDSSSALTPFPELEHKAPSVAAKPVKASAKTKAPVMKMGNNYVLGTKREGASVSANDTDRIVLKSLTQAQVASVVQSHMADVQSCWSAIPKQLRVDACTADLKLSISEAGDVTDVELGGDVPASAHKCLTSAISSWKFPTAEAKSDIEYGISLRSL